MCQHDKKKLYSKSLKVTNILTLGIKDFNGNSFYIFFGSIFSGRINKPMIEIYFNINISN